MALMSFSFKSLRRRQTPHCIQRGTGDFMIIERQGDRWFVQAPAKVNLHLEVLGKRADGYHELETVLVAVSLFDTLEIGERSTGLVLECTEPRLSIGADNLVAQAVALARSESERTDGLAVTLTKRIPLQAGLGGGSSDAAAMLAALNQMWELHWSTDRMTELGARLGSDVPFFFHGPAAVARGRGERVVACPLGRALDLVLICPPLGLSTAKVFRNVVLPAEPVDAGPMLAALAAGEAAEIGRRLHNRLQPPATALCPPLAELSRLATQWDCLGSLMTGSGSAFYALCEDADKAHRLARTIGSLNLGNVFVVRSCT